MMKNIIKELFFEHFMKTIWSVRFCKIYFRIAGLISLITNHKYLSFLCIIDMKNQIKFQAYQIKYHNHLSFESISYLVAYVLHNTAVLYAHVIYVNQCKY